MNRASVLSLVALAALGAGCRDSDVSADTGAARAPTVAAQVLRAWPHDSTAFTQGLAWHDGALYESTGRYGESSLRRVELETGRVLKKVDVPPRFFAEGMAILGGRVYQITWKEGTGFVYDLPSLSLRTTWTYDGEGWGLATDGTHLIQSDGTYRLRFVDPASGAVARTLDVRDGDDYVMELNELEWVRGEIWANVWHSDRIARIDPATGRVKEWLDVSALLPAAMRRDPEAVPNGIAWDPETDRLFVTGKLWPQLFEISLPGVLGPAPADAGAAPTAAPADGAGKAP